MLGALRGRRRVGVDVRTAIGVHVCHARHPAGSHRLASRFVVMFLSLVVVVVLATFAATMGMSAAAGHQFLIAGRIELR